MSQTGEILSFVNGQESIYEQLEQLRNEEPRIKETGLSHDMAEPSLPSQRTDPGQKTGI